MRRWLQRHRRPYDPRRYWEGRAEDLISIYDQPESWDARGWLQYDEENRVVPALLKEHRVHSVLVLGAGSGRQYDVLLPHGFALTGIDISARLVAECQARYPMVPTQELDLVGADAVLPQADAVVATAVLQHVPPDAIEAALRSCRALASSLVVLREQTWRAAPSPYQWAHDYVALMHPWVALLDQVTDERPETQVRLMAFAPPAA